MKTKKIVIVFFAFVLISAGSALLTILFLTRVFDISLEKEGTLRIAFDKTIEIPVKTTFDLPLDASIRIKETIPVKFSMPLKLELTQKQLGLKQMEIQMDSDVQIEGKIRVKQVIPFNSEVITFGEIKAPVRGDIPIDTLIPVSQMIHIKQKMPVKIEDFAIPFNIDVPIDAKVQIDQNVRVREHLKIPLDHTFPVKLNNSFQIPMKLNFKNWLNGK
ncbi:MAG: hypothetical protein HQK54_17690 [Oligoflexales bacterium]|nr:hypothetical protein [Oligoflexales bacterium]